MPDIDFDPTEGTFVPISSHCSVAVPWKILRADGFQVQFATENATKAKGDQRLLFPQDLVQNQLATLPEPKEWYLGMLTPRHCGLTLRNGKRPFILQSYQVGRH